MQITAYDNCLYVSQSTHDPSDGDRRILKVIKFTVRIDLLMRNLQLRSKNRLIVGYVFRL